MVRSTEELKQFMTEGDRINAELAILRPIPSLAGARSLSLGEYHACAVTSTGGVACWGRNERGQLGDGTTTARDAPVEVVGLSEVTSVAVGHAHSCALTTQHAVFCWGDNGSGQVGDGAGAKQHLTPVEVAGLRH